MHDPLFSSPFHERKPFRMIELRRFRLSPLARAGRGDERIASTSPPPERHLVGPKSVSNVAEVAAEDFGLPAFLGLLAGNLDAAPQIRRHCLVRARSVRALGAIDAVGTRSAASTFGIFLGALDLPGGKQRDGSEHDATAHHVGEGDRSADRVVNRGQGDDRARGERNGGADVFGARYDPDPERERDDGRRAGPRQRPQRAR
jgi:hypothetical protein